MRRQDDKLPEHDAIYQVGGHSHIQIGLRVIDLPGEARSDQATQERSLRLVAAPARHLNSTFTKTPTARKREGRPRALICPEDGERFGIADGALMRLGNGRGEVVLHGHHMPGQTRGTVIVESTWPANAFGGVQHGIRDNHAWTMDKASSRPLIGKAFQRQERCCACWFASEGKPTASDWEAGTAAVRSRALRPSSC